MDKIIQLEDHFPTGEPTVQAVLRAGPRGKFHFEKTAFLKTGSPAFDYIQSVVPEAGYTYALVNALGSFEAYDSNRNGDGFPASPYRVGVRAPAGKPNFGDGLDGWISSSEVLTQHYQTFEQAHAFEHHVNRDPGKSFGTVSKAFWNERMKRVELLLKLINSKNPRLVERINDGEYPAVSMGCFLAGTLITMADGTRRPIENIQVGDRVRTHRGRARRVTEVHARPYEGAIHEIRGEAHEPIFATAEHPFYAVNRNSMRKPVDGNFRWNTEAVPQADWVHAECLDSTYLLVEPIDNEVLTPEYASKSFARLLGYYLAEGHVLRNHRKEICGIELSTHKDDFVHQEIEALCRELGTRNPPVTNPRPHSENARSIVIHDDRLAMLCYEHGGAYAKTKKLSESVMRWHPDIQREILGAYANGDGHGADDGSLKLSTSSDDLAWQWMALLPRLGIIASITSLEHKAGTGFSAHATWEWVIHIGKQYAQPLRPYCAKIQDSPVRLSKNSRMIFGEQLLTPIREIVASYEKTTVYNFEVEEDESYVAGGLAVHNCRVKWDVCTRCGNRAPTRKEYCDHLRYHMNNVDPASGIRMCALNPSPFFFDISFVVRPADKTGYMLKKVAHEIWSHPSAELGEKVAAYNKKQATVRKIGDIQKRITGGEVEGKKTSPEDELISQYKKELLPQNVTDLPSAGDREVIAMARYPLRTVLATLHKVGAFLSTGELARVVFTRDRVKTSAQDLYRVVAVQPAVLEALARYPETYEKLAGLVAFQPQDASPALQKTLGPWLEKRATMGEYLRQRALEPGGSMPSSWGPGAAYEAYAPAKTDMFTMTDPHTGAVYTTTRGAAQEADRVNRKSVLGGTAILGGLATLGMGHLPGTRHLPLLARSVLGAGLGYMGTRRLMQAQEPYARAGYHTDQGVFVPGNIEFAKTSSAVSVQFLDKLAFDYVEQLGGWPSSGRLAATLLQKIASPSLAALFTGDLTEKIAALFAPCEEPSYDSTEPPKLGADTLVAVFGQLVAAS